MSQMLSTDCQLAIKIGQDASKILMRHFKTRLTVDQKKNEFDLVTIADHESDAFLRQAITKAFPGDALLTEENPLLPTSYAGRVWMIDPLDGTREFVAGRDCFSINIGLLDAGVPTIGIIIVPARGWIFAAQKGMGAYQVTNGDFTPIHVSSTTDINKSRLLTHSPSKEVRPLERLIHKIPFKSHIQEGGGTKQVLLASGQAEAQINSNRRGSKWDALAGEVIITEAGGMFTDLDGKSIDYTKTDSRLGESYMATNGQVMHEQLVAAMQRWRDFID